MRSLLLTAAFLASALPAYAQRSIEFSTEAEADDALVVGMSNAELPGSLKALIGDNRTEKLERLIEKAEFTGEAGQSVRMSSGDARYGEIHLLGYGEEKMSRRDWEDFGGRIAGAAKSGQSDELSVLVDGLSDDAVMNAAFGASIGQYAFDKYKSDATPVSGAYRFVSGSATELGGRYASHKQHLANSVSWVRDMQSEPANVLYPEEFVRRARGLLQGAPNVSITVLDERNMKRLGMGAILGVGQGSVRPPRMMIVRYNGGSSSQAPIVYAGKGITFDTGGISIKSNSGMWAMKADMTGAAVVMGAVASLSKSRAPVNVVAVAALAENMPGGNAQRPGDVVRSMSGKTIEIMSTDAEGRLVLSDAVWYAQEQYNPSLLVDVATLTGSVGRALGDEYAGLFSHEDSLAEEVTAIGQTTGEDVWRLPLHKNHFKQIKSVIADVKNGDTGAPGASTGAAFIGSFIKEETPWVHLDIAGVDWRTDPLPTVPAGASGYGVRLLDQLARDRMK